MTTPERIAEIIEADTTLTAGCKTALIELVQVAYRQLTSERVHEGSIDIRYTDILKGDEPASVTMTVDPLHDPFSI